MRQSIAEGFVLKETQHPFRFENADGHTFTVSFTSDRIVRVRYSTSTKTPLGTHSATTSSSHTVAVKHTQEEDAITFSTNAIRLVVTLKPSFHVAFFSVTADKPFCQDLAFRAYGYDKLTETKWHYQQKHEGQLYYGLGETSGGLDLAGRRFRLDRLDAMGYDAETSDPLYKFCPFFISLNEHTQEAYGMYYTNFSTSTMDLGQEIDALWGPYSYYQCDAGDIDYYLIYGPSVSSITQTYTQLTSRPRYLPPRFSLGYLASSMGYAESDTAQTDIIQFAETCKTHEIPLDGIHLSSGYTVNTDGDRCVFTWNTARFPDPEKLARDLGGRGIKVFANVKPWLLQDAHPDYARVRDARGFVWADDDGPATVMQWRGGRHTMGKASYIDFSSRAGYAYWQDCVKTQLLDKGYMLWLDNNEFTLSDDGCTFACEVAPDAYTNLRHTSTPSDAARRVGTPLQTLLMIQASYNAVLAHDPVHRPFLISRSATPFANELVSQTWSGDNTTAWKTIKYNVSMGLGAGLCGMPAGYGHDVGGFAGPKPDPELFVRWVQQSIFWPRFCIHSWNTDGTVTEPWMYPDVTPVIRSCIHFRYKLIPYLYTLYVRHAYYEGEPLVRPVFYDHQHDYKTYGQGFDFMLGPSVLVAPVFEPNMVQREVYLPSNTSWYHYQTGAYYEGGQRVTVDAPLDSYAAPFFVKAGSMLCFGKVGNNTHGVDDERRVQIFPGASGGRSTFVLYEDDGETLYHHTGKAYAEIHIWMETTETEIRVGLDIVHDGFFPYYDTVWVTCPIESEKRKLVFVEQQDIKVFSIKSQEVTTKGLKLQVITPN